MASSLEGNDQSLKMLEPEKEDSLHQDNDFANCHHQVTVEPIVFCYAFGILLHLPTIQQYIHYRVSESKGLATNKTEHYRHFANHSSVPSHSNVDLQRIIKDTHSETSFILLGTTISSTIPTLFMTLLLGSWSDDVGRRTVIAIAILGSITESVLILIIMCFKLNIYYLMLSSFIGGLCGYFPTITLSVFSYIADITRPEKRAFRLGILEAIAFISGMLSQISSGWWIEKSGYLTPYYLITTLYLSAFLYTIFILRESRRGNEKPQTKGLCQFQHIKEVIRLFKEPRNGDRWRLVLLTFTTANIMMSSTGFGSVFILYALGSPLQFNSILIGYFLATSFFIQATGTILGLRYMSLCMSQTLLAQIGIISVIASLCCVAFIEDPHIIFAGNSLLPFPLQ